MNTVLNTHSGQYILNLMRFDHQLEEEIQCEARSAHLTDIRCNPCNLPASRYIYLYIKAKQLVLLLYTRLLGLALAECGSIEHSTVN